MRLTCIVIALLSLPALASAEEMGPPQAWNEANGLFQSGKYEDAAASYQGLVSRGVANADVYFNLGTAQLRAGHRGAAILSFERALRLAPGDADATFNLDEALKGNVDKIVGVREEEPLTERLGSRVPEGTAGWVFLSAWLAFWGAVILRLVRPRLRGVLTPAAIVAGGVAIVAGVLLAMSSSVRSNVRYAVVVSHEAAVREGPAKSFKAAFEVHEGLKVRVVEDQQSFLRVRLPNGVEGWVSEQDAPVI